MTIQTGIDGYRLIAERTGKYSPGKAPTYVYNENGTLVSSTAYIKKMTSDGVWHEISAEAFYAEYVGTKKDGSPNTMWATKPHIMLSKCAEALALRKAFPSELSGVYTKEEMDQADNPIEEKYDEVSNDNKITPAELQLVANYTKKLPMEKVHAFLDHYNIKKVQDLLANDLQGALKKLKATVEALNEDN